VIRFRWILLAVGMTSCLGTTSRHDGQQLRRDIAMLQARLETKETQLASEIAQLQKVFDDATRLLTRNGADLGAAVAELRVAIRETSASVTAVNTAVTEVDRGIAAIRVRVDAVESRIAQLESGRPSARSSPDELWRLGSQAFEVRRFKEAISIFERLAEAYPTHVRADDALYFRGQGLGQLEAWSRAIAAYQKLLEKHPDSDLADDGLYFSAIAAKALKNCTEARTYLAILRSRYRKTNVAAAAAKLDAQLKRDARKKLACAS
jgi:TolA-binding protein